MELSESMRPADRPEARKEVDVRQEAEDMVARHARQMKELDSQAVGNTFDDATLNATRTFEKELKKYLMKRLPEDEARQLYHELTKPLDVKQYLNQSDNSAE